MGNSQVQTPNQQPPPPRDSFLKNPFYQPDFTSEQTAQLLNEFTFKSSYKDPYFKQCKVLEHKQTKELIILKEISFSSEQQMNQYYLQFQKRKERLVSENLIRLRYLAKKSTQGLLSDDHQIILLFDYILVDLYTEVNNRIRQSRWFTNEQISTILAGAVKGYSAIESQGIPNDKIRLKNIYFGLSNQTPIVKVADSNLFPTLSNFRSIQTRNSDSIDIYLAPEQVAALNSGPPVSNPKSGVYSLGVSMLQLCLLAHSNDIYDYDQRQMNTRQVEERLNIVKNKYPLGFFYILREMTEKSVDHRVSFKQLEQKLPSNIKNYSPENMTLSVIPKSSANNSEYIKSTVVNGPPPSSMPADVGNSKIIPSIIPIQARNTATLTSQYRPQGNSSLIEVNQMYTNGNAYKGFKNTQGQRHGKGKYMYTDGSYYYGDWFKNKMHGSGTLYYPDGNVEYDGEWKDDVFQGRGTLYGKGCDWIKYEGDFRAGKMDGYGSMWFNDGNLYTGSFKNDRPHGKGKIAGNEGAVKLGVWENGKFLGSA